MRSTLYLKFILIYVIFGFLSFFTVSILSSKLVLDNLEKRDTQNLYKDANLIASDYLPSYFAGTTSPSAVHSQLSAMTVYFDSSLWFVTSNGSMITSANLEKTKAPESVANFNPAEIGNRRFIKGFYHGYFKEEMITVIAPVIQGFHIRGYLLVHKPFSTIVNASEEVMPPIYITVLVIFALSFMLLFSFHYFIYKPLRKITEAATQYASGNLTYEVPVHTNDEMGYLSASLNYMSSQLKDMEDYQKKIVANVSHDFRSPLTSIKGFVQAMTDGTIPPDLNDKYLHIIQFEAERLTNLAQDLLTLNEFDTKELLLDKVEFNIQDTIKSTASSFEGVCTAKRVAIELLLLQEPPVVYGDKCKIQQVLYNLIDNAIKFSEHESSVTIEVTQKNEKVYVSIKDLGMGIPRKDLSKIWERFYKSDSSRGKDKKGTGLGLAIAREAIQAHDEHINVISTEGVGTEFIFSLSKSKN